MKPVVMSTLSGPTSCWMTSSACSAISSVRSMRVPVGARRRKLELAGVGRAGRSRCPAAAAASTEQRAGAHGVERGHRPAEAQQPAPGTPCRRARAQAALRSSRRRALPHQPGGEHRHQRARQHVGRDHREAHRQRQRHEQLPPHAHHEERRHEDRQDAEHREQARHGGLAAGVQHRARARRGPPAMWVWMFSISTVASSTSTPTASASPPSVMMLMVWPGGPQPHHRGEQRERDGGDHDEGAAPVAQEQQHHQAGQQRRRAGLR